MNTIESPVLRLIDHRDNHPQNLVICPIEVVRLRSVEQSECDCKLNPDLRLTRLSLCVGKLALECLLIPALTPGLRQIGTD